MSVLIAIHEQEVTRLAAIHMAGGRGNASSVGARMDRDRPGYTRAGDVAIIPIRGLMTKDAGLAWYCGGTDTARAARAVTDASRDPDVAGIFLDVSSGGGQVSGTPEFGDAVAAVAAAGVPVHAHIDDIGASAAYWVSSQSNAVTANRTAMVGSIGTVASLHDFTGLLEKLGIRAHVIATGEHKGAGMAGKPLTEANLAHLQRLIEQTNDHFLTAVRSGRGFGIDQLASIADGRVWLAAEAQSLGLIDGVMSRDEAFTLFSQSLDAAGTRS